MELSGSERLLIATARKYPGVYKNINALIDFIKMMDENERLSLDDHLKASFDVARKSYPGTKNGLDVEYTNFKKKFKDYKSIIPLLLPAIQYQKKWREEMFEARKTNLRLFIPEWKNFQTWINQQGWTMELPKVEKPNQIVINRPVES